MMVMMMMMMMMNAATVTLNHKETGKNSLRISKIKPCVNKYNSKGTNYSSGKDDCEKFDKNNLKNSLNVFYDKKINIYWPKLQSKHHENRIILLMIPNRPY